MKMVILSACDFERLKIAPNRTLANARFGGLATLCVFHFPLGLLQNGIGEFDHMIITEDEIYVAAIG